MPRKAIPAPKRAEIIARTAAGQTVRDIAKATGVATYTVQAYQRDQRWAPLLVQLRNQHAQSLESLYELSLRGIRTGLTHRNPEVKLNAVNTLTRVLVAGDRAEAMAMQAQAAAVQAGAAAKQAFTLEELAHSIAVDRGLVPAPAEPAEEAAVLEVEASPDAE